VGGLAGEHSDPARLVPLIGSISHIRHRRQRWRRPCCESWLSRCSRAIE
jgi:hypothetical protein